MNKATNSCPTEQLRLHLDGFVSRLYVLVSITRNQYPLDNPGLSICMEIPVLWTTFQLLLTLHFFTGIRGLRWCACVEMCVALGQMGLQLCGCK